jgi:hypothetical protein
MPLKYLHELKEFPDLLAILEKDTGILAGLVEKDYWLMHTLYGLKKQNFSFAMKGGTSLSKGYGIINRFSEDIDIQINPRGDLGVVTDPKVITSEAVASRKGFYDWLKENIRIDGILNVTRDTAFDNEKTYNSGGLRLHYPKLAKYVPGAKEDILLELGFDTVTPNEKLTISSWAYDKAASTTGVEIIDNRATDIACYHPGYTFVEKLQTIVTKYRREQETGIEKPNLLRQYYDVYCLLDNPTVNAFIGTEGYHNHKARRFTGKDKGVEITKQKAFLLSSPEMRQSFTARYQATKDLYYKGQPPFGKILERIHENLWRF